MARDLYRRERELAKQYIPNEILSRPKMGFTVPVEGWLREDLAPWLSEAVDERRQSARGLLDPAAIASLHGDFEAGRPGLALALWAVAVLEYWCDEYGVNFD